MLKESHTHPVSRDSVHLSGLGMSKLCSDKVLESNKLDDLWSLSFRVSSRVTEQWDTVDTVWSQWS